jgi:ABC-2 type transport system permease protein
MSAALRTELRKLVTTRLWWVLLLSMAGYMAFLAAALAFSFALGGDAMGGSPGGGGPPALDPQTLARTIYGLAPSLGYAFPVIIGALSVTGEFRHKTITPTLLAEPRRSVVVGAKLISSLPVGLAFGLAGTVSTVATGATVLALTDHDALLGDRDIQRTIVLSVVVLAVWCVVGVGFGTAMTNQVAAVVTLLAFNQLVEPLLRLALGAFDATAGISAYLPGAAADAVTGSSLFSAMGGGQLLGWWQGLLVLVGYGLVLAVVGRLTSLRRDIS